MEGLYVRDVVLGLGLVLTTDERPLERYGGLRRGPAARELPRPCARSEATRWPARRALSRSAPFLSASAHISVCGALSFACEVK